MEVRSDFVISMKIRDAKGRVHTLGRYASSSVDMEYSQGSSPIPHLHRTSPDGHWLASYDPDDREMHLIPLTREGADLGGERSFRIDGIEGGVRQFRWLSSDDAFAISTRNQVYLAPIPASALAVEDTTQGVRIVDAQPAFVGLADRDDEREIADLRVTTTGFFARTLSMPEWDPSLGQVWDAQVSDGSIQAFMPLLPAGLAARNANIAYGDSLVVVVENTDPDRLSGERDPLGEAAGQMWVHRLEMGAEPQRTRVVECPNDDCWVTNWAPHSDPMVVIQDYNQIAVYGAQPGARESWEFEDGDGAAISTLWAEHSQIFAADNSFVNVYDFEGKRQWGWTAPQGKSVSGVHVDAEGRALVSVGLELLRIDEGKARRLLRAKGKYKAIDEDEDNWERERRSFVDQALPLPNGAVAFTVVDLETSYEEPDWGFDEEADEYIEAAELDDKIHRALPDPPMPGLEALAAESDG